MMGILPLKYTNCKLFGLQSKQKLKELLHIQRDVYCKSSFISMKTRIYITKTGRIVEAPDSDIKAIQRNILHKLQIIELPSYMYSGTKARGQALLVQRHKQKRYTFYLDIFKFYYNISRNNVFLFYSDLLKTSNDVAAILTNFSTVSLSVKNYCNSPVIKDWVLNEKILESHLMVGSPLSPTLAFFANIAFFEELSNFSRENDIFFSAYADDLYFSSDYEIPNEIREKILSIIDKYGFQVSPNKMAYMENIKS